MAETTFLERYVAGEHEQVWAELVVLGDAVREDPLYTDALAVARETMRRARQNIETLTSRLNALGYCFGLPELPWPTPPFASPPNDVQTLIQNLEARVGTLPLSIRAWYETIGAVNLVGDTSLWEKKDEPLDVDPLVVESITLNLDSLDSWERDNEELGGTLPPFTLAISPDVDLKFGASGAGEYDIALPNPGIDAILEGEWHETTFVNYLRICLRAGGFPTPEDGIPLPRRAVRTLTEELVSF